MTKKDQQQRIKNFISDWCNYGNEKSDTQKFWIQLLSEVCGDADAISHLEFEVRVHKSDSTDFKDVVINGGTANAVLVEQKSREKDLDKKYPKSGGELVTPFEQAKSYDDNSAKDDKARWIITCNFREFWIYDMNKTGKDLLEPKKIKLSELDKHSDWLDILTAGDGELTDPLNEETDVSLKAGELAGVLYNALKVLYVDPESPETLKELNKLCVRLVFCLYAEDAGLFGDSTTAFHDFLAQYPVGKMNKALGDLFEILNTPVESRDIYLDDDLKAFPYVNGGLFEGKVQIPVFNENVADILLVQQSKEFDWSKISTTIFGAIFESTMNPATRRSGGMHYTAVENIHKVIDPLFLDELKSELNEAFAIPIDKDRRKALIKLQDKMASLKFLDPACGSGNFLTETYLCLRRMENRIINELNKGQITFDFDSKHPIKVSIAQFYGIEVNDFAVAVAQTALWIAESQMLHETEEVINTNLEFFPLKTYNNIHEGNALRMDWEQIVPANELDYIMGNPPFFGARWMSANQKEDVLLVFGDDWKNVGDLDYVSCWYKKAVEYMSNTKIKAAFVSTNSITQGGAVSITWKPLFEAGLEFIFAYRSFIWDSEANVKAHVHVVVIGFIVCHHDGAATPCHPEGARRATEGSLTNGKTLLHNTKTNTFTKKIFTVEYQKSNTGKKTEIITAKPVSNINGYLLEADNVFIEKRSKPISNVTEICLGGQAIDDGNLILTKEERDSLVKTEPLSEEFLRPYMMGKDFINREHRYCIWLVDADPAKVRKCPEILERIEKVKDFRLASSRKNTLKAAETPGLFATILECDGSYIAIPKVSSENRRYIPIDYLDKSIIPGDKLFVFQGADLYDFGVMTSIVHMAWMRVVCGRLKSDYSYSNTIVYNNFPWPTPTDAQKKKIEETAQAILDAREKYPDATLADMYGESMYIYPELVKAHNVNDKAVMEACGFALDMEEPEIVARLMEMYRGLIEEKR